MTSRLARWLRPTSATDFWRTCGVQGDPEELHRQGMLLLLTERGPEALAVACELWRRTGLHEHGAADLLMGGYGAWVPVAEHAPRDAERFLRWVLDELETAPAPPPLPADDLPAALGEQVGTRYRVQAWACGQLRALAVAAGDEDRVRRADAVAFAVFAQMTPSLAPPAARAFLAAHPQPSGTAPSGSAQPSLDTLPAQPAAPDVSPSALA
jgi:hypothetical protein